MIKLEEDLQFQSKFEESCLHSHKQYLICGIAVFRVHQQHQYYEAQESMDFFHCL